MGRKPCCEKEGLKRGPWTKEEDKKLINFMLNHGQCAWRVVPKLAGLLRCGKSCRLRWTNYLRPDLRRGLLSEDEEKLVIELHSQFGNRWSKIASHLPGRTDNEIKNIWNTHIKKKLRKIGIDPLTHKSVIPPADELHHHHQNKQLQRRQQSEDEAAASSKCSSKVAEKEAKEKKDVTIPFDPDANADADASASLSSCPEFCTDEVPMMQPHEILIPCDSSASSAPCSSAKAEEIELAYMELQESVYLWGLDDLTGWDSIDEDEVWKYDLFLFDF